MIDRAYSPGASSMPSMLPSFFGLAVVRALCLPHGNDVYEIESVHMDVLIPLWAELIPDSIIEAVAKLGAEGIGFVKVNNMLEPFRSEVAARLGCGVKLLYNTYLTEGNAQLNFIEAGEKDSAPKLRTAVCTFRFPVLSYGKGD